MVCSKNVAVVYILVNFSTTIVTAVYIKEWSPLLIILRVVNAHISLATAQTHELTLTLVTDTEMINGYSLIADFCYIIEYAYKADALN